MSPAWTKQGPFPVQSVGIMIDIYHRERLVLISQKMRNGTGAYIKLLCVTKQKNSKEINSRLKIFGH